MYRKIEGNFGADENPVLAGLLTGFACCSDGNGGGAAGAPEFSAATQVVVGGRSRIRTEDLSNVNRTL